MIKLPPTFLIAFHTKKERKENLIQPPPPFIFPSKLHVLPYLQGSNETALNSVSIRAKVALIFLPQLPQPFLSASVFSLKHVNNCSLHCSFRMISEQMQQSDAREVKQDVQAHFFSVY